ncbi:MAG: hypothetical protein VX642_03810 [Bdellovibrionota bacterium]|nr:hypothetical protein [Bdellovibrionota bacterium]
MFKRVMMFFILSLPAYASSDGIASSCVQLKTSLNDQKIPWAQHSHNAHNHNLDKGNFEIMWSGAEHLQLGDLGFQKACEKNSVQSESFCLLNGIYRNDQKIAFSYGELLALGDFYLKVDDAYFEKSRKHSIGEIFQCIDKEGKVHAEQKHNPEVKYPDCTWVNLLYGGDYLSVVMKNYDHFAWDNVKAYVKHHERALFYAQAAGKSYRSGREELALKVLNKALFINAFADHYLTDAFPAGHLRVPRKDLKNWAKKNTSKLLGSFIGDGLGMLMHDFEGKDENGDEIGLVVQNSLGVKWRTGSDTQLNTCATEEDAKIAMPLTAVELSVNEILKAFLYGEMPESSFEALWYIPFPDNQGLLKKWQSILESDRPNHKLEKMRSSLPLPVKLILKKKYIRRMIKQLPKILDRFENRISKELKESPQLQRRIPGLFQQNLIN